MKNFEAQIIGTFINRKFEAASLAEARKQAKAWVATIEAPYKLRVKVIELAF